MASGKDYISRQTRIAFRETLVGFVLREIADIFDSAGVGLGELPPNLQVSGQRRTLVEKYYSTVNWSSWRSCQDVLRAYEIIISELETKAEDPFSPQEWAKADRGKLLRLLQRDGYRWEGERLRAESDNALVATLAEHTEHFDSVVLQEHLGRLDGAALSDPPLAVGTAKELVEAVARMVLKHHKEDEGRPRESLPQLVRRALTCLDLAAEDVPDSSRVAEASRKVLGSLAGIVSGMAEIRNRYGTGHGRSEASRITPRHAMLAVGAASTLAKFMMATYEERLTRE